MLPGQPAQNLLEQVLKETLTRLAPACGKNHGAEQEDEPCSETPFAFAY